MMHLYSTFTYQINTSWCYASRCNNTKEDLVLVRMQNLCLVLFPLHNLLKESALK
jgi:hypothetical protein